MENFWLFYAGVIVGGGLGIIAMGLLQYGGSDNG